jgi:hypothetical protein
MAGHRDTASSTFNRFNTAADTEPKRFVNRTKVVNSQPAKQSGAQRRCLRHVRALRGNLRMLPHFCVPTKRVPSADSGLGCLMMFSVLKIPQHGIQRQDALLLGMV